MSAFSKFIFKATTGFLSFADKYRLAYYTHLYGNQLELDNNIVFGRGSSITIFPGGKDSKIKLSRDNTFRRNCIITLDLGGQLIIGHSNFFNNRCSMNCLGKIEIGSNNLFGENVLLYDHNHRFSNLGVPVVEQGFSVGKIKIGNNCWIGSGCIILNNVTIGDNVIIGANNLVYQSIPSDIILKSNATGSAINRL